MPNGGPDNCFNCIHNEANHGEGLRNLADLEAYMQRSRCRLRQLDTPRPHWTYCASFTHDATRTEVKGPVWASGRFEGFYVRIPWHGGQEPRTGVPVTCFVCGREEREGIEIATADGTLGFCCNRHYVEWWLSQHEDSSVTTDGLPAPEELFDE